MSWRVRNGEQLDGYIYCFSNRLFLLIPTCSRLFRAGCSVVLVGADTDGEASNKTPDDGPLEVESGEVLHVVMFVGMVETLAKPSVLASFKDRIRISWTVTPLVAARRTLPRVATISGDKEKSSNLNLFSSCLPAYTVFSF